MINYRVVRCFIFQPQMTRMKNKNTQLVTYFLIQAIISDGYKLSGWAGLYFPTRIRLIGE